MRKNAIALFTQMCKDETPMVRRAAASNLGKLVAEVEAEVAGSDLLVCFQQLSQDGRG